MSYIYTTGICELKGIDNKNLIEVIRYIAEKENYICAGNIMYKRLYHEVFKPQVIEIFRQKNINSFPSRKFNLKNFFALIMVRFLKMLLYIYG